MAGRMLVIDDEEPVLFALRTYFTLFDYQVDCASERDQAMTFLADDRYAVIIVDLRLGDGAGSGEGLELVEKARERCPEAAILLLTAYGNPAIEREAVTRGADVCLQKPTPLGDLARTVAGLRAART